MIASHCPNCGCRIATERVREVGPLQLQDHSATWAGKLVQISGQPRRILEALVLAHPRPVSKDGLIYETGSDALDTDSVLAVQICRLRKALRDAGAPRDLIQNEWSFGYRLNLSRIGDGAAG